jgi:CheY-like chemotaxis protein
MNTAPKEPRVLVVEDDEDNRELLLQACGLTGAQVAGVHDAEEALARVDEFAPDVLLIDLGLPGVDGLELARRLAQHPKRRAMSLVAVTGFGEQEVMNQAVEAGFDVYLVKPIDPKTIRLIVWNLAARAG